MENLDKTVEGVIQSLETKIVGLEKDIARQEKRADETKGLQWSAVVSAIFGIVAISSGLTWFVIDQTNQASREAMQLQITALQAQVSGKAGKGTTDALDARIQDVVDRKLYHERSPEGHEAVTRLKVSHNQLREDFDLARKDLQNTLSAMSAANGRIDRSLLLNEKLEDRVALVEVKSGANEKSISRVAGLATASFAEVESQLRGMLAYINTNFSVHEMLLQTIGAATNINIPDMQIYKNDTIPAQGTVSPGVVSTNGH